MKILSLTSEGRYPLSNDHLRGMDFCSFHADLVPASVRALRVFRLRRLRQMQIGQQKRFRSEHEIAPPVFSLLKKRDSCRDPLASSGLGVSSGQGVASRSLNA